MNETTRRGTARVNSGAVLAMLLAVLVAAAIAGAAVVSRLAGVLDAFS